MAKVARLLKQPLRVLVAEFLSYTAASAVALAVDLGLLIGLVQAGVPYLVAATVSFLAGLAVVYAASTRWIFVWREYEAQPRIELGVFLFTGVVGLLMNLGIMWVGVSVLGYYYLVPKAVSVAFTFAWNFISRKVILFMP